MDVGHFLGLFASDPQIAAKTGLRFVHFIGLALGLGGAVLLDLMMLRFFVRGRIVRETYDIITFSASVVSAGLWILWITGIGFLFLYALTDPALLTNPKIHAKLVIVLVLTLNGILIHSAILPNVQAQIGKSIFHGMSPFKRALFLASGAVSCVSWLFPVALGAFSQLNFEVPALTILLVYLALVLTVGIMMQALSYALDMSGKINSTYDNVPGGSIGLVRGA